MTRRSFLDHLASAARAAVGVLAGIPVVRFLLAPLRSGTNGNPYVRLIQLSDIEPGETKRVIVVSDRLDGFTRHPPGPIGSVWLIREDDGEGEPRLRCLQSICPHLGCAVDQSGDGAGFRCPCHGAAFDETGRCVEGPSPRDMDELDVLVTGEKQKWVEVRYRTFATGTPRKKSLT